MSEGQIVHIEFSANSPENSGKFYSDVFGWKIEAVPQFDYALYESPGGPPHGGFARVDNQMYKPGFILVYIEVDDLEGMLKKVEAAGGKVLMRRQIIPEQGWFAVISDPTGNTVGLWSNNPPV